jgi:O-antigen/teichoic acid export membrane protein
MNKLSLNLLYYYFGIAISGILSFLFIPAIIKMCGVNVYANFSIIFNILNITAILAYSWLGQSYIRFATFYNSYTLYALSKKLLLKSLAIGSVVFIILSLLFSKSSFSSIIFFLPAFFLFGFYNFFILYHQSQHNASLIMVAEVIRTALNLILPTLFFLIINKQNYLLVLAITTALSYTVSLLLFYNKVKNKDMQSTNQLERKEITSKILKFGLPISIFLSGSIALSVNDRIILSNTTNDYIAGEYSAIYDIINKGIIAVFSPILMTFYPILTNLYNKNKKKEAIEIIKKLLFVEILLTIIGVIFVYFFGPLLMPLLFKSEYNSSLNLVAIFLFVGVCLWQIAMILHKPLELSENTKYMALFVIIAFILNVTLNCIFIIKYKNIVVPAITTITSSLLYIILIMNFTKKNKLYV